MNSFKQARGGANVRGLRIGCTFCVKEEGPIRNRSLFIAWGGGGVEDFGGDHLIFRRTKGGSVITHGNPKGRIAENFARIQRGDHSNVLGK